MKVKRMIATVLYFLSILILISCIYANYTYLVKSFSQIVFLLQVPSQPGDMGMLFEWGLWCLLPSILLTVLYVVFLNHFSKFIHFKWIQKIIIFLKRFYNSVAIGCLIFALTFVIINYDVYGYMTKQIQKTEIYETYYRDPKEVQLKFPEQKRNLIHIYLESIESSFVSKENGGISTQSYIKELEQLALNHINFSQHDLIGGSQTIIGTQWTIGAQVGQDAGIPLTLPIEGNSYTSTKSFLPGAYTIGNILEDYGYHQVFLSGSKASFGGTENFYQHGNYEIKDYDYMIEKGYLPSDYYKFWGYEDRLLFDFAKKELSLLASQSEPFNLEMITMDAHMPYGYECENCPKISNDQYENVLACQSKQVSEFIEWCQQQDFYENTTIVITGDHNSMAQKFFDNLDKNFSRTPYNVFINTALPCTNNKNRQFSAMDFYPTILASMGVEIEGERLGLGTNLFSNQPTLLEELGWSLNTELQKKSDYYTHNIIGIK
ncbi:MAG: LTA synthase family protein [Erysipelotrichaceae bacterium]|nr:LTA synthase family protein [Erysipelotrichaceae bacterium]